MLRQLAAWGRRDPAELTEEEVGDYFLYLVRERKYAPATLRQARAAALEDGGDSPAASPATS